MSDLTVRQVVPADLGALVPLFDRYRQFQGRASDPQAASAFLQARFDHGESVIHVAEEHGTLRAFAQLYPSDSSVALARVFVLNDLYVEASARRRGIATAGADTESHRPPAASIHPCPVDPLSHAGPTCPRHHHAPRPSAATRPPCPASPARPAAGP